MITRLGYNGEFCEPDTNLQLLGNGYRAYSSVLMRFLSWDDWSPFGLGLFNGYAYCGGEPMLNVDDSGHMFHRVTPKVTPKVTAPLKVNSPATPKPSTFRDKVARDNQRWAAQEVSKPHSSTQRGAPPTRVQQNDYAVPQVKAEGTNSQVNPNTALEMKGANNNSDALKKPNSSKMSPGFLYEFTPPAQVSIDKWHRMNVFQRLDYTQKGGKPPIAISSGNVRRNVFDRPKNSRKQNWD